MFRIKSVALNESDPVQDALSSANQYATNLSVEPLGSGWVVRGGEKPLLVSDNRDAAEAFVCGYGLALKTLPNSVATSLVEFLRRIGADPKAEM